MLKLPDYHKSPEVLHMGYEKYGYFGIGTMESYADKNLSARMGFFNGNVDDDMEHYVKPQENGSRFGARYAAGHGLAFERKEGFMFRVSHYSKNKLTEKEFNFDFCVRSARK